MRSTRTLLSRTFLCGVLLLGLLAPPLAAQDWAGRGRARGEVNDDKGKPMELGVRVGDTVYYGKYAGTEVTVDGDKFVILRESDILGVLE